ncbi:MAG TPA: hypothetical protein VL173_12480 [Vicinamibacterales bacterium]|jgi:hypothetical protein|nr:hypothetical protein [Vicinamibacterales bacterium]
MKRLIPFVLCTLALAAPAFAQRGGGRGGRGGAPAAPIALEPGASQADVDKALMAAPDNVKAQATVIKWNPSDWTYTTLRKGTNKMVCFDKSGLPGQPAFLVECTTLGNLPRAAQNMKFETEPDRAKRQAALDAAEKDGTRVKPEFGSVWYHAMNDPANPRHHMTIAVPMATKATLGIPEDASQGGVWIMNPGTTTAHLMTPGE